MKKAVAIILAGGIGQRFKSSKPKQYIKLAGKEIIEYTIDTFERNPSIYEIVIVASEMFHDHIWKLVAKNNFMKVHKVINAGATRIESTKSALMVLQNYPKDTKVLIHDAVRPLVDNETITNVVNMLENYNAVDTAIDATDTIVKIDRDWFIEDIPLRQFMKRGQTPQGFRLETLQKAYNSLNDEEKELFTCDCSVVHKKLQVPIKVVKSNIKNIKITHPIDLYIAEKYIQMGLEYNLYSLDLKNLKDKRIVIIGNSSGIGKAIEEIAIKYGAEVFGWSRKSGFDVTDEEIVKDFFQQFDYIDVVINTAGLLYYKPFLSMKNSEIHAIIETNFIGVVNIAKHAYRPLNKNSGMLINFASSSYTRGRANYALYSATKAAVVNFSQALSQEWEGRIKVNCISPQRTKTPMRTINFGKEPDEELLKAEDVATYTLQLALSDLSGIVWDIKKLAPQG